MYVADRDRLAKYAGDIAPPIRLGAALVVCLGRPLLDEFGIAASARVRAPWCPLVFAGPDPLELSMLRFLRVDLDRVAVIRTQGGTNVPSIDEIGLAIARRGPPTAGGVQRYVSDRRGETSGDAVRDALDNCRSGTSGLRRRLARHGLVSPKRWRSVLSLVNYLHSPDYPDRRTLEQVALSHDRAPRTLSYWCARYLGCTWIQARRRFGWEWAIEVLLRQLPASQSPPPLRPSPPAVHHCGSCPSSHP